MNLLDLVQETGLSPKRKSSTHGGEYCCACPFCQNGTDRFLIWPNRPNKDGSCQGGRYSCRVCGKYGDAITFLRDYRGLSYKEACEVLRIEPKQRDSYSARKKERPATSLPIAEDPPVLWQEKAAVFVDWCHENLLKNKQALELVTHRGFDLNTIKKFKLGFNPGDHGQDFYRSREDWGLMSELRDDGKPRRLWLPVGIVVPTFSRDGRVIKVKVRRSAWKEGDELPKYVELSGSKRSPSIYGDSQLLSGIVLESELDSILIQQFAADLVFCIALGGSTQPIDRETDQLIKTTPTIIFVPDFDDSGVKAWVKWKRLYPHVKRLLSPLEKSAGDAFLVGVDLRDWILDALQKNKER